MPTVSFWLNAFIPRDVAGYTIGITKGPHAGKTAIPLPTAARAWPGNMTKSWNAGYLTDQRGFSNLPTASARMQSRADVDVSSLGLKLINTTHTTSGTTEVDTVTGAQLGFAKAIMTRSNFKPHLIPHPTPWPKPFPSPQTPANVKADERVLSLDLEAAAGDPLVGMAADIDYVGVVTFILGPTPGSVTVSFDGKIDAFPAYDCYASLNGLTKEVFRRPPPPGNTVLNLLGRANTPVSGRVSFP